jgi:hypothetical protein
LMQPSVGQEYHRHRDTPQDSPERDGQRQGSDPCGSIGGNRPADAVAVSFASLFKSSPLHLVG